MNIKTIIKKLDMDELIELKQIIDKELSFKLKESDKSVKIIDLDISVRAINCLRYNKIEMLNELTCVKPSDLKNLGQKTIQELTECLNERGLSWGV